MATPVVLDVKHPTLGLLASFFAQRVASYAAEYQPEVDGWEFASGIMAKLWLRDQNLLAIGIVDESGRMVGHALASAEAFGSRRWVVVTQLRADEGVGSARIDALKACVAWAASLGIPQVLLTTNRDGKEFANLGFKRYRTGHRLALSAAVPDDPDE